MPAHVYPDNSHSARENASPPSKRVEKVVNGTAKTRKQSEVKKFAGIFMPDEVGDVKTFIITDVVIPGLKNAIADVVSIVLFGEARPHRHSEERRIKGIVSAVL